MQASFDRRTRRSASLDNVAPNFASGEIVRRCGASPDETNRTKHGFLSRVFAQHLAAVPRRSTAAARPSGSCGFRARPSGACPRVRSAADSVSPISTRGKKLSSRVRRLACGSPRRLRAQPAALVTCRCRDGLGRKPPLRGFLLDLVSQKHADDDFPARFRDGVPRRCGRRSLVGKAGAGDPAARPPGPTAWRMTSHSVGRGRGRE
jgi:hypothetical protein